jgi:hypothetical protein
MLDNIKSISNQAITRLTQILESEADPVKKENIQASQNAYEQLLALIEHAEQQHATLGLGILSRQLNQTSAAELNATELMKNFLKVLEYPNKTTFSMNKQPHRETGLDISKQLAMLPLLFVVPIVSALLPALLASPVPWLLLIASAIPLLAVYAFFDEPLSMSRLYQEMAGIEAALAYVNLGMCIFMPFLLMAPEIPLLVAAMALTGLLVTGLSLLKHSQILQEKHNNLDDKTNTIKSNLDDASTKTTLHRFFNSRETDDENTTHQALESITATA